MFCIPREFTLHLKGGEMDCVSFGRGKRNLVIIPGLSLRDVKGSGWILATMYRCFAKDFRVYVLDKKRPLEKNCTVADLANDTAEAVAALGILRACFLGVSLGGMVALYLGTRHSALTEKLVVAVTLSRPNERVKTVTENWISLAENGDFSGLVRDMFSLLYSHQYVKKYGFLLPLLEKFAFPKDKNRFVALAKACMTCQIYDELEKISCPIFVIGGKEDSIVTGKASEEIGKKTGCEIFMYENLGHSAYEEGKDFNRKVLDFLNK